MGRWALGRVQSQGWYLRRWYECAECCRRKKKQRDDDADNSDEEEEEDDNPQYTLSSRQKATTLKSKFPCLSLRQRLCWCCSRSTMTSDERDREGTSERVCFVDINGIIAKYLSWSYRTSYFLLLTVFGLFYYSWVVAFALIFYGISAVYPECINSGGEMIGASEGSRLFGDCFQLSWTTFSTVGYGVIFPATGASSFYVPTGCVAMGVLGSLEAFVGVLYAGFCGAILFGKVLRSQNNAQVFFSDPIVVRFGKLELSEGGSSNTNNVEERIKEEESKEEQDVELGGEGDSSLMMGNTENDIPCPSLEFRLVNRLHGVPQGEIVEARLDCVAILDPKIAQLNQSSSNDGGGHAKDQVKVNENTTIAELAKVLQETSAKRAKRGINFHSAGSKKPHMFTKITLDAEEHPYFRRVWFGRHRLDENSPLLTPAARKRVKQANGFWPADMNNHLSIKKSIHFKHVLVCISGTSNANAASVYAQKVYDLVDVNVGYRFVPMNYHTDEGEMKTDPYLLNAVYQQRGGGAEPFQ